MNTANLTSNRWGPSPGSVPTTAVNCKFGDHP